MGWAIYRGFELIRKGDDDTRLVIDYSADVPVERPYTEEENTIADAQALAIDAYEEHMRKRKEAFENAIQVPILFEDVEERITETNTILEENQQKVEANIQAITQLRDTTLPALEATLTQARDEAAAAKATADSAVVSSINEYTRTDTIEEVPTDDNTWSTETPEYLVGYHYWMRTILTRGDGSTTKTSPVLVSSPGTTGEHGIGIQSMDVYYYRSLSSEELVGGAWTTTAPAWISGQFVWEKIVTTFTDGMTSESDPINITGAFGSDGDDGVGIVDIQEQYYLSTSSSQLTGGSWSNDVPAWVDGRFYWTLSVITYTDNTTHTTTPKMVSGGKGADGSPGLSVVSITPLYRQLPVGSTKPQKPSGTGTPSGWSTTEPDYAPSTELYRTEQVLYSNDTASYTDVTLVSSYTAVVTLKTALDNNEVAVANLRDNTIPALNSQLNQSIDTLAALQSKLLTVSTNYPPSSTEDYPSNAQWIRVDSNNSRIGFWIIQGNNWVPSTFSPTVIPALDAGIITSGTISTARLNTTELAAAIATIIELNADRITTGTIDTGRLRAEEVAAAIATFLELDVGNLVAGTADIDEAVVQKLFTDMFATRQLSAEQVTISAYNLFPDPWFKTGKWTGAGISIVEDLGVPGKNTLKMTLGTASVASYYGDVDNQVVVLEADSEYKLRLKVYQTGASTPVNVAFVYRYRTSAGSLRTQLVNLPEPGVINTWREVTVDFKTPVDLYTHAVVGFTSVTPFEAGKALQIADVKMTKQVDTSMIVDGGILARHIVASEDLWAKVIGAHKITSAEIAAGAINAEHVVVGGLRPENFAFGIDEMIPNPNFSNADLIAKDLFALEGAGIQYNATAPRPSGSVRRLAFLASAAPYDYNTSSGTRARLTDYVPAKRGDMFYLEATLVRNSTSSSATRWAIRAEFFDASKAYVGHVDVETPPQSELLTLYPILNTEFKISGMIEAPANTSFVRIVFVKTEVGIGTTAVLYVSARRAMAGTNSLGARSILSPEGLQIYAVGSEIGADPDIDLTSTQQGLLMRDESQEPTIQLTRAGSVYARRFEVDGFLEYNGKDLEQILWNLPRGLIKRAEAPTGDITNITTELGIIETGTIWLEGGRMYKVRVEFGWTWVGAASEAQSRVRYTSSATGTPANPTINSTVLTNAYQFQGPHIQYRDDHASYEATFFVPTGSSEYRRLLATVNRNGGTGTIRMTSNANGARRMRMFVYDLGPTWRDGDPVYEWTVLANDGGGTTVPPKSRRTLTINSIGAATWTAAGVKSTYHLYVNSPTQGRWNTTDYRGAYYFSDSDLTPVRGVAAGDIESVSIYLTNVQTGDGTAHAYAYASTAANNTDPNVGWVNAHNGDGPVYGSGGTGAAWRALPANSRWGNDLRTVMLKADGSTNNYGRWGSSAQLQIVYWK